MLEILKKTFYAIISLIVVVYVMAEFISYSQEQRSHQRLNKWAERGDSAWSDVTWKIRLGGKP